MATTLRRCLHEPLLHFLVLGAAIFAAYGALAKPAGTEPGRIVVTQGQISSMVETFVLTRQRPPTDDEVRGMLADKVREEVYYRAALAMGLDKDDIIIRRRLWQKMLFVTDNVVEQIQPTDAQLNVYLEAHPDAFRLPRAFTFSQVFLDPNRHGEHLAGDAARLLSRLTRASGATDVATLGDPVMLEHKFDALPALDIAKLFGEDFANALASLTPGQWQGPIASAYGVHLVLVSDRSEERVPALGEVRGAVQREWTNAMRKAASEKFYSELLKHYTVTIERPEAVQTLKRLAASQ